MSSDASDQKVGADSSAPKNMKSMPVRAYLDETVVPLLLSGMSELVKARPEDPVVFLASYLLKHNPNRGAGAE